MRAPRSELACTSRPISSSACASARPRVHCITNAVAQNFTANVLLAAGAMPSMTIAPNEVGAFVARADALLVNLGTFDRGAAEGRARGDRSREQGGACPGCSIRCSSTARRRAPLSPSRCVAQKPRAMRLNAAEFARARGGNADDAALDALCAEHARPCVGADRRSSIWSPTARGSSRIANGHPLMARVTAMGCAGVGAGRRVPRGRDRSRCWRPRRRCLISASRAKSPAARARGPGSFAVGDPRCAVQRSTATR